MRVSTALCRKQTLVSAVPISFDAPAIMWKNKPLNFFFLSFLISSFLFKMRIWAIIFEMGWNATAMELNESKQIIMTIIIVAGLFIFGVSQNDWTNKHVELAAKHCHQISGHWLDDWRGESILTLCQSMGNIFYSLKFDSNSNSTCYGVVFKLIRNKKKMCHSFWEQNIRTKPDQISWHSSLGTELFMTW